MFSDRTAWHSCAGEDGFRLQLHTPTRGPALLPPPPTVAGDAAGDVAGDEVPLGMMLVSIHSADRRDHAGPDNHC
jgi:hypothetical protein